MPNPGAHAIMGAGIISLSIFDSFKNRCVQQKSCFWIPLITFVARPSDKAVQHSSPRASGIKPLAKFQRKDKDGSKKQKAKSEKVNISRGFFQKPPGLTKVFLLFKFCFDFKVRQSQTTFHSQGKWLQAGQLKVKVPAYLFDSKSE